MSWYADVSTWTKSPSVIQVYNDQGESVDYLPERTCYKDVQRTADGAPLMNGIFVCSECRFPWDSKNLFCGHCGAKVVE